jgi:hypothetical protein
MLPARRELLIAGIIVACITLGLLLSTLIFRIVRLYQLPGRTREPILFQKKSKQRFSLGTL